MKVISFIKAETNLDVACPASYQEFIGKFGYGSYCDLLYITEFDRDNIRLTFSELDLWDEAPYFRKEDLKKAVQIASSMDGDIICFLPEKLDQLFILPRHAEKIMQFSDLPAVLAHYQDRFDLKDIYFEPFDKRQYKSYSLIWKDELLNIESIHDRFLTEMQFDFVIGKEQPKYVIEKMGGSIVFDLAYKNNISINYQINNKNYEQEYLQFIEAEIQNLQW